jgi:cytoskeletal protein CcmA (bactofilin family)
MSDEKRTVVEEGTELRGVLSAKHPVVVAGKVEGELEGPLVQVSDSGVVAGKLKVGGLRSSGEIAGEIQADEVQLSGRVRDKTVLRAQVIEVNPTPGDGRAGVLFGDCDIEVGDVPDKQAVIAAAAGSRAAAAAPAEAPVDAGAVPQVVTGEGSAAVGRKGRKQGGEPTVQRS